VTGSCSAEGVWGHLRDRVNGTLVVMFLRGGLALGLIGVVCSLVLAVQSTRGGPLSRTGKASRESAAAKSRYLFLADASGDFLKVDTSSGGVAAFWQWNDLDAVLKKAPECSILPSSAGVLPAYCGRDITDMRYDPVKGRIYMLAPNVNADRNNPQASGEGSFSYRLYCFSRENMKVIATTEIAQADAMMVTPDGETVLVQHFVRQPNGQTQNSVDIFRANDLKKTGTIVGRSPDPPAFGSKAYFLPDGKTSVVYGYLRTHWDWTGGSFTNDHVDPRSGLSAADKSKLQAFEAEQPNNHERILLANPGDTSGEKTVFWVADKAYTKIGLWTVNSLTQKTSPAILGNMGLALLSPDQKTILLAGRRLGANGSGAWNFNGDFSLYDVASGSLLKQYSASGLGVSETEGGPVCLSPDGSLLAYLLPDRVLLLDVSSGKIATQTRVHLVSAASLNYRLCWFSGN
jgi:hypothetical protein